MDKVKQILSALGELSDTQVALTLLRHCAFFGKLVYSLHVVPHRSHSMALHNFDTAVRDCIESFLCCSFSESEWSLATLSTKMGGLGLRRIGLHSPAAFLSSQAACHELCSRLDPKYTWNPRDIQSNIYSAITDFNMRVEPDNQLQFDGNTCPRQ